MTANDQVPIRNKMTGLYGIVSSYVFEHPVFGQYMELDTRDSDDCIDCGAKGEAAPAVDEEGDELFIEPLTTKTTKDK